MARVRSALGTIVETLETQAIFNSEFLIWCYEGLVQWPSD